MGVHEGLGLRLRAGASGSPVQIKGLQGDDVRRPQAAEMRARPPTARRADRGWPAVQDMLARIAVLEQAAVFFGLPDSKLRALARRLRRVHVARGELILLQGEPGDSIFFVESGRCRVLIERGPSAVTVAVLAVGDFFGEAACLFGRPQQASVYAQTDCSLLALDRQSLHSVLGGYDRAAIDTLRNLAEQRFRIFDDTTLQAAWGMLLQEGTVIGVYSPKGGSGGTCIALNLVGSLARRHPGEVLLLDLDFPYSHAALLSGLIPTGCLARMGDIPPESLEDILLSAVLVHAGGPMILPGALKPEEADSVTPDLIARAIGVLRKTFRYIVVDLGVAITDATLALFDLTQDIVLIAAPDISAVKSASDAMEILRQLGTPEDRITVVLNNRTAKPAVSRPAVERALKRAVDVEVGFDGARPEQAALGGVILSLTDARSEITRATEALAAQLVARHTAPPDVPPDPAPAVSPEVVGT